MCHMDPYLMSTAGFQVHTDMGMSSITPNHSIVGNGFLTICGNGSLNAMHRMTGQRR